MIQAIYPCRQTYDTVVVLGGTPIDTYERFSFTKELVCSKKLITSRIVYLNGLRELAPSEKQWLTANGYEDCQYQHQGPQRIWDKLFSSELKGIKLECMTIIPPSSRRANTQDTVKEFFETYSGKSFLFITNGPYKPFQEEIIKGVKLFCHINFDYEVI